MAELDDEGFGEFKFAPQHQFNLNQINVLNTTANDGAGDDDEDDWGDFVATPHQRSTPGTSPQFNFSNGFSHQHQSPQAPSTNYDPLGFFNISSPQSSGVSSKVGNPSGSESEKLDKPRGPLPLSLFGLEEEDQKERSESIAELSPITNNGNGEINPKAAQMVKNGFSLNSNGLNDIIAGLYTQNQQIKDEFGSNLKGDLRGDNEASDYDEDWEFKGAVSENGSKERNPKEEIVPDLFGSKTQTVSMIGQEKQAGQEAPSTVENKPALHVLVNGFAVPFAASNRVPESPGVMEFALNFNYGTVTSDVLTSHPRSPSEVCNGNGIASASLDEDDDFDEFGDFIDASSDTGSKSQGQHAAAEMGACEAQLSNGKIQVDGDKRESLRGALPLSFFSDGDVSSEDSHEDILIHKPAVNPKNSVNRPVSKISIHDLISNLYSEAQPSQTSSFVYSHKATNHASPYPQRVLGLSSVDGNGNLDNNNSWEFKDALTKTRSTEQPVELVHTLSARHSDVQTFLGFYSKLRDALCLTISSLLDDIKTSAFTGNEAKLETDNNEIQDAYKILEDSMPSYKKENFAEKHSLKDGIDELLEILRDPKFQLVDSEYLLSSRLPLAEKDWRIAVQLLRHAKYTVRILAMASEEEQSSYVGTWLKILSVCSHELKHGTSVWKRALERGLQDRILSDIQGQQKILALGEVYRVAELIGATVKLYKPWICLNMVDHMSFFQLLDECSSLWSSSGLPEALQNVSAMADSGQSVIVLTDSLNNIRDIDLDAMHDATFKQQSTICRLSLLPHELFQDLKMVLWNDESYFVNIVNLWANLISCSPPRLPQLHLG